MLIPDTASNYIEIAKYYIQQYSNLNKYFFLIFSIRHYDYCILLCCYFIMADSEKPCNSRHKEKFKVIYNINACDLQHIIFVLQK